MIRPASTAGAGQFDSRLDQISRLVLESIGSPNTRRVFAHGLKTFLSWRREQTQPGFDHISVERFRAHLEAQQLASSSINAYLSAIRKLARVCAAQNFLDPREAAMIAGTKGAARQGTQVGRWLTAEQAGQILVAPDVATLRGLRDRAILALLVGCGLRRAEFCRLDIANLEKREGRWVISIAP